MVCPVCVSPGALLQDFHGRQDLALDELEERAATGGNIGDPLGDAVLVDRRQGIAAAGDGERRAIGDGVGQGTVPSPNWSNSNTLTGPFHRMVFEVFSSSANCAAVCGPMSRIMSSSATSAMALTVATALSANSLATTTFHRQRHLDLGGDGLGGLDQVGLVQRLAGPCVRPRRGRCWRCRRRRSAGRRCRPGCSARRAWWKP